MKDPGNEDNAGCGKRKRDGVKWRESCATQVCLRMIAQVALA